MAISKNPATNSQQSIENLLQHDEVLISTHKPHKKSYITKSLLRLLLIVITCSLSCVVGIIIVYVSNIFTKGLAKTISVISLLIVFLTPLWLWIDNFTNTIKRHKFVEYFITNKRVILKKGDKPKHITFVFYSDVFNMKVAFSPVNEHFKTGDIKLATYHKWIILHSLSEYNTVGKYLEEACKINMDTAKKTSNKKPKI